jgi:hypothetical protein
VPNTAAGGLLERPRVCLVLWFELHPQDQIQACPTRLEVATAINAMHPQKQGAATAGPEKLGKGACNPMQPHATRKRLTQRGMEGYLSRTWSCGRSFSGVRAHTQRRIRATYTSNSCVNRRYIIVVGARRDIGVRKVEEPCRVG